MLVKDLNFKSIYRRITLLGMACLSVCLLLCALTSCGEERGQLEQKIQEAVQDPAMLNEQTFNELAAIITASPEDYRQFLTENGRVDLSRLQELVDRIGKRHNPEFVWNLSEYGGAVNGPLSLRLMLERSGSMDGYDARSGSGDFKRAVGEMLTRFPGDSKEVFIVNDGVYPYTGSLNSFVQDKDIFSSTKGVGDPSYTDFAKIFDFALTDTVPERITVLVTDMIYSPRGTRGVSASKIFNEAGTLATTLFTSHKDKSVIVVKLTGDFHGTYYPYSRPSGVNYSGSRPYYMIVIGSASAMQKLRGDAEYASFADFGSLPGYEADYFFNRNRLPLGYYGVMPRGKGTTGSYELAGDGDGAAHALKEVRGEKGDGLFTLRVAVDLSQVPATDVYLCDKANYEADGGLTIEKAEAVTPAMTDARTKRYLEKATHLITLKGSARNLPERSTVTLKNRMPSWIAQSTAESDAEPAAPGFSTSTFGLLPFMQGIYSAYYGTASVPDFINFTISFK